MTTLQIALLIVFTITFAWLSPVVVGLVLAIPISAATARQELGRLVRRLGLLVTPEESDPPAVLQRANQLACELATGRHRGTDALEWMASDAQLRTLHRVMLLLTVPARRKGEYDVDLLLGLAKLHDAASIEEASSLLSSREKLAMLGNQAGLERFSQLATVRGVRPDAVTSSRNPLGPHPPISPASEIV